MTISEYLDKTMVRDTTHPNLVHFDSSKLDEVQQEEDDCASVCIHCVVDEQAQRIENLEAELWDTQNKLNALINLLNLGNVRALK